MFTSHCVGRCWATCVIAIKTSGCPLDARADIYSAGRIIAFLLSHSADAANSPVFESLQAIATTATSQERDSRYPTAQAMLASLQAVSQRKKRRWPWAALSVVIMVLLGCVVAQMLPHWRGYDFYQDNLYSQVISQDSLWCRVVGKDDSLKGRAWGDVELTIPSTTHWRGRNYQVIEVGEKAFANHGEIAYLSVATGVREIGVSAFQGCDHLRQVHLPEGMASIGQDVFVNCAELQHVGLPSTLQHIGRGAFFQCEALQELTLPEGLEHLGEYALMYCPSLRQVTCLRPNPIQIDEVFDPVDRQYADSLQSGLRLLVPATSIDLYRKCLFRGHKDTLNNGNIQINRAKTIFFDHFSPGCYVLIGRKVVVKVTFRPIKSLRSLSFE